MINWPDGLDAERFLADYWQQQPLLIRQAFPDFENPLSPDELGGLALEPGIASRLILRENQSRWHLRQGPFEESELTSLPASDWSLLVSDIDKHLEGFHHYLTPFRFLPDWRIDDLMISYAPAGASVGPHTDQYDVFLLQAAGHREWQIRAGDVGDLTLLPDHELAILANFNADQTHRLEPGDMLYLPPGVPHHGISCDNDCMTWSVGFRAPSDSVLLESVTSALVDSEKDLDTVRWRDNTATPSAHPGLLTGSAITEWQQHWHRLVNTDPITFSSLIAKGLTQLHSIVYEHIIEPDQSWHAWLQTADAKDRLERNPFVRMLYTETAGTICLYAGGKQWNTSLALAQCLCDNRHLSLQDIAPFTSDNDITCLAGLWANGFLIAGDRDSS